MSLTASGRFGGGAAPEGRRRAVLSASVALHGVLVLGLMALGHRVAPTAPAPPAVEMRFEAASAAREVPLEPAVVSAAPDVAPAVAVPDVAPAMPVPETSVPALGAPASVPESVRASLPVADSGEVPVAETVAPSVVEEPRLPAPRAVVARAEPRRVAARAVPAERRVVRPSPPVEVAAAAIAAPIAPAAPPPVRTVSVSSRWQGELAAWVRARTRYPTEAKQRGEQGAVVISFTVGRDGQVLDALLRQRSGSESLDQAALAIFRAARVPAFPPDMAAAQVTISVPVRYRLEE